jgi:hypothetical protein
MQMPSLGKKRDHRDSLCDRAKSRRIDVFGPRLGFVHRACLAGAAGWLCPWKRGIAFCTD